MYLVKPPLLAKPWLREALWRIDTNKKELYLTFDDGPVPEVTPRALELLAQYNAQATFFCLGKQVQAHPDLYAQVLQAGHRVGNHTWNHPSGWKTPLDEYLANVERCAQVVSSNLFRPPYGRIQRAQLKALAPNYTVVMWEVISGDFDAATRPDRCASNVIRHAKPGSIVVFHDSQKAASNMLAALPQVLEHFSKEGWSFKALP